MTTPLYDTPLPIRAEIGEAQAAAVRRWSAPGTWWTAAERVAIVEEVRRARDADELPPWTAPSSVPGLISDHHPLPAFAVDVIWRVTNHVTTLTREWYGALVPAALSAGHYVELLSLVAQVNMVDRFADGLGLGRIEVGPAAPGEPTRTTPDGAAVTTHWVPTAPDAAAGWRPAEQAGNTGLEPQPEVPNVLKALSLVPPERNIQMALIGSHYVPGGALSDDIGNDVWSLQRTQMELIGAITSAGNECFY